jgi:two-component system OmpR family sensor kinase/two-component system sensor histidine kinase BaeS
MIDHHMIRPARFQEVLAEYYTLHGGWADVDAQLPLLIELASDGAMSSMMRGMMGMHDNRAQILDETGAVVADTLAAPGSSPLPTDAVQRWPITVGRQEIGFLLVEGALMAGSPTRNNRVVTGVTRAVLLAGLTAGVVGLLLAGLLVRQITRPLSSMTTASRRIAAGDLSVSVPVQSGDELGELAATFNQMAGSLQKQETLRRNLMADIAHELRTPLTAIQGTVEALQDGVFPVTAENLQAIHEQAIFLSRLVEDLRTLAHAEAGQLALDLAPLDLAGLCQRRVAAFQPQARDKQIDLTLHTEGAPVVRADEQRLGQVLNNLIDNAFRYTPSGGAVRVRLTAANGAVRLAVVDSGEGIKPADLPHIFERFYRAQRAPAGGSGLGLAIARQLIQAHGGRIWAESPPSGRSEGSAVILELRRHL